MTLKRRGMSTSSGKNSLDKEPLGEGPETVSDTTTRGDKAKVKEKMMEKKKSIEGEDESVPPGKLVTNLKVKHSTVNFIYIFNKYVWFRISTALRIPWASQMSTRRKRTQRPINQKLRPALGQP